MRALFEIFGRANPSLITQLLDSVFREGDRREAELCLYTGWIVLEKTIRMVVLLLKIWIWGFKSGL